MKVEKDVFLSFNFPWEQFENELQKRGRINQERHVIEEREAKTGEDKEHPG